MVVSIQQQNDILKVVLGLFNAAPGKTYLTEFITRVDNGTTIAQLADELAADSHFTEGIMSGKTTTAAQVAVLMDNFGVLQSSDTSSAGFQANAFFTDRIDAGVGFGAIVHEAVTFLNTVSSTKSPEFSEIATLLANKVLIAEAYSATNSSSDLSILQNVVKNVTGTALYTPSEVASFIASINDTTVPSVIAGQSFNYIEAVNGVGPINDTKDVIGTVLATDNNSVNSFAITAGNDSGFFAINSEGQLTLTAAGLVGASNNFESVPNSFALTITAEDLAKNVSGGQAVNISVRNNPSDDSSGGGGGRSFLLTTSNDNFVGTNRSDTFDGTYDAGVVTDTFNGTDILAGNGGTDTLNIHHLIDVAMTPPDALWAGLTGIEKVVINTTGNGAQTITTGGNFDNAFNTDGVDFTSTTSGSGAINITMSSFTGDAVLTTESLAGAQTILTGSAATSVNATSTGGALDIKGLGLSSVTALTTGAGAQVIGGAGVNEGENLITVNATAQSGAQTIISTSTNNVTVNATTGAGALIITTGVGDDSITLTSTDAAGTNIITGNAGGDAITLASGGFAASETIVIGNADSGITLSTADSITNFVSVEDFLKLGSAGDATAGTGNYVEAGGVVANFTAALTAANTALATLNGTSIASELYSFQWDATNGYLFTDTNSDGSADQVVELIGITGTTFAAADIIV